MVERQSGVIVNVSTIEAFRGIPTRAVYAAFKAGITGLTKSLALEYAQHGIRVNAIAPDVTETLQVPYSRWVQPDEEALVPLWVPLGRFGTPADLAGWRCSWLGPLGLRDRDDGARRRRDVRGRGLVPTSDGTWTNRPRRP